MLCNLLVENYALISKLEIDFTGGLTTITGETGAGKSILLGAMSLILGKRADTSVLLDRQRKCIVEGTFDISRDQLAVFFEQQDLEYDKQTTLRREISPAGKSRAFINDSPVTLEILSDLGTKLIDIHSQYQTLNLGNSQFQMKVVDSYARNQDLLAEYQRQFNAYQELQSDFKRLSEEADQSKSELEYLEFQYSQIESARLTEGELEELEIELEKLSHAEEIKTGLSHTGSLLEGETNGALQQLKECLVSLARITGYLPESAELHHRMESAYIEIKDVAQELDALNIKVFIDPDRLNLVRERLDLLYSLLQKHHLKDISALIHLRKNLELKIGDISTFDDRLAHMKAELVNKQKALEGLASQLSREREKALQPLEAQVTGMLRELAIPNASFRIKLKHESAFNAFGKDSIQFLFTANKNGMLQEISKVASGGELSRLMLSVKSLMSDATALPTIIFDEIDTGISGEVAEKVGNIIHRMAEARQVINITHLPQIASKGNDHFLVFKTDEDGSAKTMIKRLSESERHYEIARMLSGEEITAAALENARMLLKN